MSFLADLMTSYLPLLALAVALLWLPRSWVRRGVLLPRKRRSRPRVTSPSDPSFDPALVSARREFVRGRNYFDFVRAAAGAALLTGEVSFGHGVHFRAVEAGPFRWTAAEFAILLLGALIQTVRFERGRLRLTAPLFYLAGLSLALCSPWPALSGFGLAWALSAVMPNVQGFLTAYALFLAAFGMFLDGLSVFVAGAAVLAFTPVLLSLLTRQPLLAFSRRGVAASRRE